MRSSSAAQPAKVPLLTWPEWIRMAEIAFDEAEKAGRALPLLGGASETSTGRVLERVKALKAIGYRYFVATPVYYLITETADEHFRLFGACHEAADGMEMIPYNIPKFAGCNIPVETLVEMARRGWIHIVKESSGNLGYLRRVIDEGRPYGLRVFTGDESQMKAALEAGAAGIVPGCANFEPETFIEAYRAGVAGCRGVGARRCPHDGAARGVGPGCAMLAGRIKYAVACLGIGSGKPVRRSSRSPRRNGRGGAVRGVWEVRPSVQHAERRPDFERLKTALLRGEPDYVPLYEVAVDGPVMAGFMGRPVSDPSRLGITLTPPPLDEALACLPDFVAFYAAAGYDFVRSVRDREPGHDGAGERLRRRLQQGPHDARRHQAELGCREGRFHHVLG